MTVSMAFNYGGRAELVDAVQAHRRGGRPGRQDQREDDRAHLYDPSMPDPELVVRTSGEIRTSNFLMWESAYSEWCSPTCCGPTSAASTSTTASRSTSAATVASAGSPLRCTLYRDVGIVLRTYKLGEADRIVVIPILDGVR